MRKIFSAFFIFGLIGLNIDIPKIPKIDIEERIEKVRERIPDSTAGTYADASYANKQTSFSPGQMVYVFVEARINESAKRSLVLQDENKNHIKDIPVSIGSNGYAAEFSAPSEEGMYYLHLEVTGEGLSIVFQTNINVGGKNGEVVGESTVISDVTAEVISDKGRVGEEEVKQIMPNNRLNVFQIVGWWLVRFKELIINYLSKA